MNLAIATYATEKYSYALPNVGRRIASALHYANINKGTFIFIGDKTEKIKESALLYIRDVLPSDFEFKFIALNLADKDKKNYKNDAQLLIAQMQQSAFVEARKLDCDYFWSIESDVLVSPNSLQVSLDMLAFDKGYYDVCMCPYPSQGGGSFLGGRGTYQKQIEEDFSDEERVVPEDLQKQLEERNKQIEDENFEPDEKWHEEGQELYKKVKECPPKENVFLANGKKWKKRGWLEYAYPAIGKGSVVPTDWVGLGCTLISRKALSYSNFDGYQGAGTQDLYLGWTFWKPNEINMCVTPHSICDHIIRKRGEDAEDQIFEDFIHVQGYHELEGELEGHLRQRHVPFYTFIAGEKYREPPKEDEQ